VSTTSSSLSTSVVPWRYAAGRLHLLDQRRLPNEEVFLDCESAAQTAEAIRSLAVRGAPLIGVAAAFGLAAEARRVLSRSPGDFDVALEAGADRLAAARPTAVNLSGAVERIRRVVRETPLLTPLERTLLVEKEAEAVAEEDRLACIAERGASWLEARWNLPPGASATVLTHCNAGALATAGIGTALGVVRGLSARRPVVVFADETRPFFQGARLTAWELLRDGVAVTLLPDVAAAWTIASGAVAAVIVGADRIARNGDVANKVGTYGLALACRANGVPFVVAAPTSTLDPLTLSGADIPIERRSSEEVLELAPGVRVAPAGVTALYPAFDVTPSALVDAIVTEVGVSVPPHEINLRELLPGA
jgi:methylthioribose-1-phosphate isomerase